MAITILVPTDNSTAQVDSKGKVCVRGDGAIETGTAAVAVHAKIYQPPAAPSNPLSGPPTDAHTVTPDANGNYYFGLIGTAEHDSAGNKDNKVWVWAEHGTSSPSYDIIDHDFKGATSTGVPSCPTS